MTIKQWYLEKTKSKQLIFDQKQLNTIIKLDKIISYIIKQLSLSRIFKVPRLFISHKTYGCYLHGNVGSGKTMILDQLYSSLPVAKKTRVHFHEFMADIHNKLANLKHHDEPLKVIAKELKKSYHVIVLDEMHVSDIATAMILKNLFTSLFNEKIFIITSSNFAPDQLYLDGLMRVRFLPAIKLIKNKLTVLSLNTEADYRLTHHQSDQVFFINHGNAATIELNNLFTEISNKEVASNDGEILIHGRNISYVKMTSNIIWFDFKIICGDRRSQLDYLDLSKRFKWIFIENIYQLSRGDRDIARRFTWLIDILYDNKNKLAVSSLVPVDEIYLSGDFANEFSRTISRLKEMQTTKWLE